VCIEKSSRGRPFGGAGVLKRKKKKKIAPKSVGEKFAKKQPDPKGHRQEEGRVASSGQNSRKNRKVLEKQGEKQKGNTKTKEKVLPEKRISGGRKAESCFILQPVKKKKKRKKKNRGQRVRLEKRGQRVKSSYCCLSGPESGAKESIRGENVKNLSRSKRGDETSGFGEWRN